MVFEGVNVKKFIITFIIAFLIQVSAFAKPITTINVAFTIDNNYPIFTLLAINSILQNNYSTSDYHFYIIENNITPKNKDFMQKFVHDANEKYPFKTELEFINIDTFNLDKGLNLYAFSNRISSIAMARILLPDLLKDLDRVLYLDGDILVTGDLRKLYRTNLEGNFVGMTLNIVQSIYKEQSSKNKIKNAKRYYNSGVILFDLKKCRKFDTPKVMLSYLEDNIDYFLYDDKSKDNVMYLYPDQDLINIVLKNKIKTLPNEWNNQVIQDRYMVKVKLVSQMIIHYIGPTKPWHFHTPRNDAEELYMAYWNDCQELKPYKYYYFARSITERYSAIVKIKLSRYKTLCKNLLNRSEVKNVFEMFKSSMKVVR